MLLTTFARRKVSKQMKKLFSTPVALLAVVLALLVVVPTGCSGDDNGGDDVLVENDIYTVTPDSVIEGKWVATSKDGLALTSNYGGQTRKWKAKLPERDKFAYTSEQPIVDAVYNMSVEAVDDYVAAGATGDSRLLNHEQCYYIERVLAILNPELSMKLLRDMTIDGCIDAARESPMLGGHHIWAEAAWQVYLSTGDKKWLKEAHDILERTLKGEELLELSGSKQLVHGSAPMLSVAAYYPLWMNERDLFDTYSLDENLMVCRAYAVLYDMGEELELINDYRTTSEHLKASINSALWSETQSGYSQFSYGAVYQANSPRTDNLGQAMSVLWDVADDDRAETLVESSPVTHYGVTAIYPCVVDSFQHLGTLAMPFLQSYWNQGAAKVGNTNMLRRGFGTMIRAQALAVSCNITIDATTGDIDIGGNYSMANACGNLAMIYKVMLGINLLPSGIEFNPCVTKGLAGLKVIRNFKYRKATLDINVSGCGNDLKSISLDGKQLDVNFIDAGLTGHHVVDIVMNETDADAGKVTIALPGHAIPNPPEVEWDGLSGRITNYVPGQKYRLLIGEDESLAINDSVFTVDRKGDATMVMSMVAANSWGDSFRSLPHYYEPKVLTFDEANAVWHVPDSVTYSITVDAPQAGNYLMWVNYSLIEKAAARLVNVNTHLQGMAVLPKRDKRLVAFGNEDDDDQLNDLRSNVVKVMLLEGKNTITLTAPAGNALLPHYRRPFHLASISLTKL